MEHTALAEVLWAIVGYTAQAVFAMRFIWQWIVSERRKQSVIPVGFWYFSLVGGIMLTVYAFFRDPVLLPGQVAGVVVYVRNLVLIHRGRVAPSQPKSPATPGDCGDAAGRLAA
jgi:lipid-A-disaccharide synthase-like uncharacterized protein